MSKPKRIYDLEEKAKLHTKFCQITGYSIPVCYFLTAPCYGLKINEEYVGGFILKHGRLRQLRAYQEMPELWQAQYESEKYDFEMNTVDMTGYFLTDKKYGVKFTWFLVKTIFFCTKKYFIYSYDLDKDKLKKYYSYGKPRLLYSGYPVLIDGYGEQQPPVNVEILSKWGILKIFLARTKKAILGK